MAAPSKNQFWKERSRHGRDKIFKNPDTLWIACCEYFEATHARKWTEKDYVGKDGKEIVRESITPYTYNSLYVFLDIDSKTWKLYEEREDFIPITSRVRNIIYTQKFEGAALGFFNAQIISRDLGLTDKTQSSITAQPLFPDVLPDNLNNQ